MLSVKKMLYKILQRLDADLDLRRAEVVYSGTFTIPSACYLNIATGNEPFKGHAILSINCISWGTNTGAFSVCSNSGNEIYLIGNNGVKVTNLAIRVIYVA